MPTVVRTPPPPPPPPPPTRPPPRPRAVRGGARSLLPQEVCASYQTVVLQCMLAVSVRADQYVTQDA